MGGRRRDASVPQSFERLEHAALRESWLDNEFTLLGVGQQISATSDLWGTLRKGLITCLPRVGDGDVTRLLVAPARSDRVWHRAMDHTAAKQCTVKHIVLRLVILIRERGDWKRENGKGAGSDYRVGNPETGKRGTSVPGVENCTLWNAENTRTNITAQWINISHRPSRNKEHLKRSCWVTVRQVCTLWLKLRKDR